MIIWLIACQNVSVVVKLNSGVDYRGVLVCLDGYMNIALEQVSLMPLLLLLKVLSWPNNCY